MTTREDFEAVFTSAKAYANETTGDYLQPYLQAWQAWQAATAAALERAAVACESLGMTTSGIYERNHECASAIRALKDEE